MSIFDLQKRLDAAAERCDLALTTAQEEYEAAITASCAAAKDQAALAQETFKKAVARALENFRVECEEGEILE